MKKYIHRLPVEVVGEQGRKAKGFTSGPVKRYPTEPSLDAMDKSLVGTILHLFRDNGSIR
jgi:hypothetical protein